jgi:hypothetical protein
MTPLRRIVVLCVAVLACRGTSPAAQTLGQRQLELLVDSLMPGVAKATGLEFKSAPKSALRTKEQIRAYLVAKMERELPQSRIDGISATYRLLGMLSDTINLRSLFLDLYTEQIAGFYEPDSTTLFAVQSGEPAQLRLVLSHELVHALQHEYVPLDSIMHDDSDADRQFAAQSVLEGQATLASITAMVPGMDLIHNDAFWLTFRDQLRLQQTGTGVFATAPMVIREGLIFPYLDGGEFVRWFEQKQPGKMPFGASLPTSTEQILHPDRYLSHDAPLTIRFSGPTAGTYEDTFGEFDIELLRTQLTGATTVRTDPAIGWGGDRMRVYSSPTGPALVWYTVWDEPRYAERFQREIGAPLSEHPRAGYRVTVEPLQINGKAAMRIVIAPTGWELWKSLPAAEIR